jgi:hypothetical protein
MGLAHDLCSKLHLIGCFGEVFGREFQSLSGARVLCSFYSSSLMFCPCQGRCCVPALGSYGGGHRSVVLKLCPALPPFVVARACESIEFLIC